jgi:hypothetical protein
MSMTDTMPNLTELPEGLRAPFGRYVETLREIFAETACGVTAYGPAVTGEFDPEIHAVRSVLVVEKVDLNALRRLGERGRQLGRDGIAAPLIMTPEYVKQSLDTFPLELIEIGQTGSTVLGENHFADLSPEDAHVRLQCERELKVLLIGLRQGLLKAAGREQAIAALELDAGVGLQRTMRGLLWLKGERKLRRLAEVFGAIEKATDRKWPAIRTALDRSASHGWQEFVALYDEVQSLSEVADAS